MMPGEQSLTRTGQQMRSAYGRQQVIQQTNDTFFTGKQIVDNIKLKDKRDIF